MRHQEPPFPQAHERSPQHVAENPAQTTPGAPILKQPAIWIALPSIR